MKIHRFSNIWVKRKVRKKQQKPKDSENNDPPSSVRTADYAIGPGKLYEPCGLFSLSNVYALYYYV